MKEVRLLAKKMEQSGRKEWICFGDGKFISSVISYRHRIYAVEPIVAKGLIQVKKGLD